MTLPTWVYVSGLAVLVSERSGRCTAGTVTVSVGEVIGPDVALATLVTEPLSRSAWGTAWAAWQVSDALGARLAAAGQVTVVLSSLTVNGPFTVTLPLLVSR